MITETKLLTPLAAAQELGVAPQTVVAWARRGIIRSIMTSAGGRLFTYPEVLRVKQERAKFIAETQEQLAYTERAAERSWAKAAAE